MGEGGERSLQKGADPSQAVPGASRERWQQQHGSVIATAKMILRSEELNPSHQSERHRKLLVPLKESDVFPQCCGGFGEVW